MDRCEHPSLPPIRRSAEGSPTAMRNSGPEDPTGRNTPFLTAAAIILAIVLIAIIYLLFA